MRFREREREKCLGRWRVRFYWERSKRNERKSRWSQYIEITKLDDREVLRCYWELSTAKRPQWIKLLSSRQNIARWIKNLSRSYRDKFSKASMDQDCVKFCLEKRFKISIDSLAVERYREAVKKCKNYFSKKRKTHKWMQSSMLLNQRSN